jgi:bacteriocin-like protein
MLRSLATRKELSMRKAKKEERVGKQCRPKAEVDREKQLDEKELDKVSGGVTRTGQHEA